MNAFVFFVVISFPAIFGQEEPTFHVDLAPEERLHYFGTELLEDVPRYEYTTPQPIDRRRRRGTDGDNNDKLQYLLNAFGTTTHLILDKNKELISPGCIVQRHTSNGTLDVYPCSNDEMDCFYTGISSNHSNSWIAASVCGGMHGVIGTPENTLMIQPIKNKHMSRARRDTSLVEPHIIYHHVQKGRSYHYEGEGNKITKRNAKQFRMRRSSAKRYIETAVVADPTVYKFHGKETEKMLKTLMNVVAQRYLDASLQSKLYLTVNKVVILEKDQPGLNVAVDSGVTLNSFCDWQTSWNPTQDSDPSHADYTVFLTKVDLEHMGSKTNSGLARQGMCGLKTSCSVNEEFGLGAAFTIAHETGHVLSMNHDSDGNTCANNKNIMASFEANGPGAFKWSSCSAKYLKDFLSTSSASCLNDAPPAQADKSYAVSTKPGTIYSVNQQCKLMLGKDAEVCEGVHANGQDVCGGISCRPKHDTSVNGCVIYSMPRMDGTDCGGRKWCIQGSCVDMGPGSPAAIDGGWSDWETDFSDCSRSCGGGVKIKRRFCTNPEPMYGGKACAGSAARAELCNMQECTTTQIQFKNEQCSATDNTPIQGKKYHWVPNSSSLGDDNCKIDCNAEGTNWYSKRGISADGTECQHDTPAPFSKCVSGLCKNFGCDGHMDSGHVFDKCGICNGQGNTCRKISGNFNGGEAKEFTTFVRIPKGSTGITITQGNQYCYLSATVNGQQLFRDTTPRLSGTYKKGGVIMKYQSAPERIQIVGPVNAVVEAQVYRKWGPPYVGVDPDVYYEYHIPTSGSSGNYLWKTRAGACTKSCGTGTQKPTITCVNSNSGTVDDYFCDIHQKPSDTAQSCNANPCPPRWRTSQWSQCSKSCAGGQRHRSAECVQENNNVESVLSEQRCQGQSKPTITSTCNTGACPGTWKADAWTKCSETCGRGVRTRQVKCYSSSASTTPIADSSCAAASKLSVKEYCVDKPCRTDISGDACKDKQANCFTSYGEDVCSGQYKSWAHENCMKSCGVCAEHPSDFDPDCKDEVSNCNQYTTGFCTSSAYAGWAKSHCKKFCGFCAETVATTAVSPAVSSDCMDTDDCPAYGKSVCTEYASWAKTHCKNFCNLCELVEAKPACDDQESNCASYGSNMCTEYKPWATSHCKGFCGLCDARRKRDVSVPLAPSLDERSPPLMKYPAEVPLELSENYIVPVLEDDVIDVIDDITSVESDGIFEVPTQPLCNTVRTSQTGAVDITGKLLAGTSCEQVIALSLDKRVLLKFNKMQFECESGDTLLIIDGISGQEIPVCNSVLGNEWLASGNIVILKFTAGIKGHGYAFTYETFVQNKTIAACSQHFTSAVGEITTVNYPSNTGSKDDTCEIYITGTPGKNVQITFHTFTMDGDKNNCSKETSVVVKDIDGGEEDLLCGELSPFIWESRGSRVLLVYKQMDDSHRFSASYVVQDL